MRKSILKIIVVVEICILIILGAYIINDKRSEETSLKITFTPDVNNITSDINVIPEINKYEPETVLELGFPFKYINNLTDYPVEMPYAIFSAKPD